MNLKNQIKNLSCLTIIFHWDTDGLASAVKIYEIFKKINPYLKIKFYLPSIGNYSLSKKDILKIKKQKPQIVIIVDFNLPKEDIFVLKRSLKKPIFIFDHHLTSLLKKKGIVYINPISQGKNSAKFPSSSYLITRYFKKPLDFLSIIGAIGDQEEKIKENKYFFPYLKKILKKYKLSFNQALKITKLIDSNYILGKKSQVLKTLKFLINHKENPKIILKEKQFKENLAKIEKEVKKILKQKPLIQNKKLLVYSFSSSFDVISRITRQLSRKNPKKLIIVKTKLNNNWDNIYFRRNKLEINLKEIIKLAKKRGFLGGGKEEVCGIILPRDQTKAFLKEAISKILTAFNT